MQNCVCFKKLARLLYQSADQSLVKRDKVEKILGLSRDEAERKAAPAPQVSETGSYPRPCIPARTSRAHSFAENACATLVFWNLRAENGFWQKI